MRYLSSHRQLGKGDVFGLMSFLSFVFLILACAMMGLQVVDNVKADKAIAAGTKKFTPKSSGTAAPEMIDGGSIPGDAPPGDAPPGDAPPGDAPPG
ncbi:MAG: hypothetical protein O2857_08405, partial [Planctomycetota bacterium]|nr:hypothetical protein [Planctomycetota bacterium]